MTLTLEITPPQPGLPPDRARQTFTEKGGTIGRAARNTWVLPHKEVSGQHAVVSFQGGIFYIEDTSTNGIAINSPENRLVRERPYALKPGDRLFIQPYVIGVSIEAVAPAPRAAAPPHDDPFVGLDLVSVSPPAAVEPDSVDPLSFFPALPPQPGAVKHVEQPVVRPDPLSDNFEPPRPAAPDPAPFSSARQDTGGIPVGYDPMKDDPFTPAPSIPPPARVAPPPPPPPPPPPRPRPSVEAASPKVEPFVRPEPPPAPSWTPPEPPRTVPPAPTVESPIVVEAAVTPPIAVSELKMETIDVPPLPPPAPPPVAPVLQETGSSADASDLAHMLAGAGLHDVAVTPELMRTFGQILRIVVAGMMDVLQARQRIKEEFQMRMTTVRPADNNPLKFSANVEDALHNLLVKRNVAYLGPVEAFGDAFDDLRHHQLAMLAGMRVAFQTMMAEFDPDRMQEEFDRQIGSALALKPASMRYWELYREKRRSMLADPESAFAHLFGEQFARAYDEQFRRLKAERRSSSHRNPGSGAPYDK